MPDTVMSSDQVAPERPIIVQGPRQRSLLWGDLMSALAKAQGEIEGAKKDSQNPHFKSSYADLASVWTAVREPLSKHGIAVMQWPRVVENAVEIETIVSHGEQFVSDVLWMPCGKMDAHGIGSAITYGRRYALMAVAGVAPEDDDGNGAVDGHKAGASGTAGAGTQYRPERRSSWGAGGKQAAIDEAQRDGLMDEAKPKPLPGTPAQRTTNAAARGNAIKRIEWTTASIAHIATLPTKEALADWWRENKERLDIIESAIPTAYERLVVAYDAAMDAAVAKVA